MGDRGSVLRGVMSRRMVVTGVTTFACPQLPAGPLQPSVPLSSETSMSKIECSCFFLNIFLPLWPLSIQLHDFEPIHLFTCSFMH